MKLINKVKSLFKKRIPVYISFWINGTDNTPWTILNSSFVNNCNCKDYSGKFIKIQDIGIFYTDSPINNRIIFDLSSVIGRNFHFALSLTNEGKIHKLFLDGNKTKFMEI